MNHGSFKISASSAKILLAIDRVSKFALVKDYIYAKKGHSVFFVVFFFIFWKCSGGLNKIKYYQLNFDRKMAYILIDNVLAIFFRGRLKAH